ncbi:ABC transporter substrate-binding protein [Pseudomonas sp. NPDC077186]|uniref:ABC transporter substrate-binding protein n=1 Tax=Pseudomonas sp. NPDC077186 TaxID=3364421 RepID=UPI0037C9BC6D
MLISRFACWVLLASLSCSAWAGADAALVARQSAAIAAQPQRIVSLDELTTELLVSLGIEPVGVANLANYRRYIGIGDELLEHSVALGSAQQPDLEAIARLKPDLVVGVAYLHLQLFERLDGLAPTLIYQVSLAAGGPDGVAIGEAMLLHLGQLTGRQAQARQAVEEARAALAAAQRTVREGGLAGEPVAVLYPLVQQGTFIALNQQTLIGSLMARLGVHSPWPLHSAHSLHRRIDMRALAGEERLRVLFIGGQVEAPFFDSRLWRALPLARRQHYGFLATPYWTFGGPRSTAIIAAQIGDALQAMNR